MNSPLSKDFPPVDPFVGFCGGTAHIGVREDGHVQLSIANQIFARQDIKELRKYLKAILRDTKA